MYELKIKKSFAKQRRAYEVAHVQRSGSMTSMQCHSFLFGLRHLKVTGNTLSSGRAVKESCMKGQGEPGGSLCLTSAVKSSDQHSPAEMIFRAAGIFGLTEQKAVPLIPKICAYLCTILCLFS